MEDIVRRIFQPYNKRYRGRKALYKNIHLYRGKHYMERSYSWFLVRERKVKNFTTYDIWELKREENRNCLV